MSMTLDELRSEINRALKTWGARVAGVSFTLNEEASTSADRGIDMQTLANTLGTSAKKEHQGTLLIAQEGAGGKLITAITSKIEEDFDTKRVSDLVGLYMRNFILTEERDRDGLTGFLKKETFRARMLETAKNVKKGAGEKGGAARGRSTRSPVLTFFHLDLDHFKEINDTLGHRFGDEVLKSFARQVRDFFSSRELGEILLARLGGEEFGVLLPYLPAVDGRKLAVELCSFVRNASIPTPSEIERYQKQNPDFKALTLPGVTVSIGTATADSAVILRASEDALAGETDQLYERADIATYVAKKLGRDRVMAFESILAEGGTVLDYDNRTGIVTLDLGSDMGVDTGDIFRVYDNRKFTGREPIIQPGSQNKIIGYFPRLVLGEIEVTMAQPQVSFAQRRGGDMFIPAPGFLLEWVPPSERGRRTAGDRRRRDRRKTTSTRSLFEARLREAQEKEKFSLVLLFFDNLTAIKEQRGSSTVKELYRSLAAELEKILVPGDVSANVSSELIGFLPSSVDKKRILTKLTELKHNFAARDKATFSAVVFSIPASGLPHQRSLEIARKGVDIARFKGTDQVLELDHQALLSKLVFYYEHGEYDKVAEEFGQLNALGVKSEEVLVHYAEALSYLGRVEEAMDTVRSIMEKDPGNLTALEVLATSAFEMGRYSEAVEAYEKLVEVKKKEVAPWQWRDYGISLLYLGEIEKALENLDLALEQDPTDASAVYQKGEVLLALGKKEQARNQFMHAFEMGFRELSPQAARLMGEG